MGCIMGKNQVHIIDPRVAGAAGKTGKIETDDNQERGGSATSKASRHSGDSGFNDEVEAAMLNEQHAIQKDILCRQPLAASGGKRVERVEEKHILDTLHEEGLIQKPINSTTFGMSFEVFNELAGGPPRRLPPRLAKLETKKKKKPLTEEQIREKLERAEQRRKDQEHMRVSKLHTHNSEIQNSVDTVNASKENQESNKTKEELAAENREARLREKLDRLRIKREHAEEVRKKKKLLAEAAAGNPSEDSLVPGQSEVFAAKPALSSSAIDEQPAVASMHRQLFVQPAGEMCQVE